MCVKLLEMYVDKEVSMSELVVQALRVLVVTLVSGWCQLFRSNRCPPLGLHFPVQDLPSWSSDQCCCCHESLAGVEWLVLFEKNVTMFVKCCAHLGSVFSLKPNLSNTENQLAKCTHKDSNHISPHLNSHNE